ncbi:MAG: zf-HC2 domain-containing protein [Armatimonadota bacterium]|nr:zf-HC2 domain-containing protein [Armatimonadota bacterium]
MLDCKVVLEKLSCYVDGVVDEATLERIEDHLHGCRECREELAALEAVRSSMMAAAEVEPPAGLKFAIREAVSREEALSPRCEQVVEMLSEFVDGELAKTEVLMVTEHVDHCESCARELALTQRMLTVASSVGQVEPPATLKARIAAATVESATPLRKLTERVVSALRPVRIGLAAGAAVAASVVFLAVKTPNQPSTTESARGGDNKVERIAKPVQTPTTDVIEKSVASSAPQPVKTAGNAVHKWRRPGVTNVAVAPEKKIVEPKMAVADAAPVVAQKAAPKPAAPDTSETTANAPETPVTTVAAAAEKPAETTPAVVAETEAKKDKPTESAAKPEPVKVAGRPAVPNGDDRAMIRSLKQQMRLQKKGEGVSVNLFGSKF